MFDKNTGQMSESTANSLLSKLKPNVSLNSSTVDADSDSVKNTVSRIAEYGDLVLMIATFLVLIFMLYAFFKLSLAADDPQARKAAMAHIFTVGIAISMLGGFTLIVSVAFNFLG